MLMEKVNIGISSQELRLVMSEADENENGVIGLLRISITLQSLI